ncbi:MAG: hypothetical protein IH936_02340 [Acidobacteria bacterium]|nr:hypothetical protein [Acidobacteriota bacterium]
MPPRGRKPAPTALKLIKGVQKKDPKRINKDEPKPEGVLGKPPARLVAAAKVVWKREAPFYGADTHRAAFAHYCTHEADADRFRKVCDKEGWWITGSAKSLVLHPAAKLYQYNLDKADKLLSN